MQQNKHIPLALGALACAGLLTLSLGVGITQARYDTTTSCSGIYAPEDPVVRSNFLAPGGQTVLMEDWNITASSYQVLSIQLSASKGQQTGTLQWQTDSELITASLDQSLFTLDQRQQYAMLTLSRTNAAAQLTEPAEVTLQVSWIPEGQSEPTSWADFTVTLLPGAIQPMQPVEGQWERGMMTVSHPDSFAWDEQLPLILTVPAGTQWVELSCDGSGFPVNTRYRVDDRTPLVLANEMMITVPTEGQQEIQLMLDFSWTEQNSRNNLTLSAVAYAGGTELAVANVTVSPQRQTLQMESEAAGYVLKAQPQLRLSMAGDTEGLVWTLERLTRTKDGIVYVPDEHLTITTETENTSGDDLLSAIVISNDKNLAPAGTYRLTLQRTFGDAVISSCEVFIFVCY